MKIKSFFLGSAAVLVAVCNAKAADVVQEMDILVEPEPVEYVRVCDAYGAGFFYIPGTETCLKFSGYVRADVRAVRGETKKVANPGDKTNAKMTKSHTNSRTIGYRGRLNIDARNETEWGTLRSQIRFHGSGTQKFAKDRKEDTGLVGNAIGHGSDKPYVQIARALISLSGFRAGYSSDYWSTVGDYGYFDATQDGIYGNGSALLVDYTFAFDGFTVTAGAQSALGTKTVSSTLSLNGSGTAYNPDLYVGATYSGSWGKVFGTYYHDASAKKGAYKVGAELDLSEQLFDGSVKGWYINDNGETSYVQGNAWGITAKMDLAETFGLYGGYSRYTFKQPKHGKLNPVLGTNSSHTDDWTLGTQWNITSGLNAKLEYNNRTDKAILADKTGTLKETKTDTYIFRVTRTF